MQTKRVAVRQPFVSSPSASSWQDKIRAKGLHLTILKEKIIGVFEKTKEPLSVQELLNALKRHKLSPHKTTLYRELESLVGVSILEELKLHDGLRSYELKHKKTNHHHHFICEECSEVIDFNNSDLEQLIKKVEFTFKRKGVAVQNHALNLYGLCAQCQ